jgi:hypothetical protein
MSCKNYILYYVCSYCIVLLVLFFMYVFGGTNAQRVNRVEFVVSRKTYQFGRTSRIRRNDGHNNNLRSFSRSQRSTFLTFNYFFFGFFNKK